MIDFTLHLLATIGICACCVAVFVRVGEHFDD